MTSINLSGRSSIIQAAPSGVMRQLVPRLQQICANSAPGHRLRLSPTEAGITVACEANMCSHEEKIVTQAVDLAERLLDEVVRANVRWRRVEHLADTLAKLAARAASCQGGQAGDE
jgi:hypothetical protein